MYDSCEDCRASSEWNDSSYVQQKLKGSQTPTVLADTSCGGKKNFCLAGAGAWSDLSSLYAALAAGLERNSGIGWSKVELGGAIRTTEDRSIGQTEDCQISWTRDIQTYVKNNQNPSFDHFDITVNLARLPGENVPYDKGELLMATDLDGVIIENRRGSEAFDQCPTPNGGV